MAIRDLAPGDLLYKILYPRSNEVRQARTEREVARLRRYSAQRRGGGEGGGGGNTGEARPESGGSSMVPIIDSGSLSLVTFGLSTKDGVYQPRLQISIPAQWREVRGFLRYQVRVVSPSGEERIFSGPSIEEGDPGIIGLYALPETAGHTYQVQARIVSDLYGPGPWSAATTKTVAADAAAPADPVGLAVNDIPNGVHVSWTAPTEEDYEATEVWVGQNPALAGSQQRLVDTTSKPGCTIFWDYTDYATWTYIWVRHYDRSRNLSGFSTIAATPRRIDTAQIADDAITGPKLAPTIDLESNLRLGTATGGVLTLRAGSGNRIELEDVDGVNFGGIAVTGDTTPADDALLAITTQNGQLMLNSAKQMRLLANSLGVKVETFLLADSYVKAPTLELTTVAKSASFTADLTATTYIISVSLTSVTVSLPAASTCSGLIYFFKRVTGGATSCTIDPSGSETIDGATTYSLANQYQVVGIQSDGSNWHIISKA